MVLKYSGFIYTKADTSHYAGRTLKAGAYTEKHNYYFLILTHNEGRMTDSIYDR